MPDRSLVLRRGEIRFPAFLPDATAGVVRGVDAADLERAGVDAVVMNIFHLMQRPGITTIRALGGLHRMSGWHHPIMTDSGGFQAYSLIRQDRRRGRLTDDGLIIQPEGTNRRFQLTPEKCIELQVRAGADIVVCLDDCTHPDAPMETQREAVRRTIAWARRGRQTFDRLMDEKEMPPAERPLLFAVIQGGQSRELRRACADELLALGFDGYGFGGWPFDDQGNLLFDLIAYTRELVGPRFPMHALGIGSPTNIVRCARAGYEMFDSALPTRDARQGRLYTWNSSPSDLADSRDERWFSYLYIADDIHWKNPRPISPDCDCWCCQRYSVGYLHHLHALGDALYIRLATIHNLRFVTRLTEILRTGGGDA
jgi:queuine tRNA-ribosyltransferase